MSAIIQCSSCQRWLQLSQELLGKAVKCPLCGAVTIAQAAAASNPIIPNPSPAPKPINVSPDAIRSESPKQRPALNPVADAVPASPPLPVGSSQASSAATHDDGFGDLPTTLESNPEPRSKKTLRILMDIAMPQSVIGTTVCLVLLLLIFLFDLFLRITSGSRDIPIAALVYVFIDLVLLVGIFTRQKALRIVARLVAPLAALVLLYLWATTVYINFLIVGAHSKFVLTTAVLFLQAGLLLGVFFGLGRPSTWLYFRLVCPRCEQVTNRFRNSLSRSAQCSNCHTTWEKYDSLATFEPESVRSKVPDDRNANAGLVSPARDLTTESANPFLDARNQPSPHSEEDPFAD